MDFWENFTLLMVGAAVTGVTVPWIKALMDDRRFKAQKQYEADLTRQGRVIVARTDALGTLAELLWQYHYLADQVAYAATHDEGTYDAALESYNSEGWQLLARTRSAIGGMRWFMSRRAYDELVGAYRTWCDEVNERTGSLLDAEDPSEDSWSTLHEWFVQDSGRMLDDLLGRLADEFGLPGGNAADSHRDSSAATPARRP